MTQKGKYSLPVASQSKVRPSSRWNLQRAFPQSHRQQPGRRAPCSILVFISEGRLEGYKHCCTSGEARLRGKSASPKVSGRAGAELLSIPPAAPAPILLRFQMSSCSNLQSCTVVVKDSFLYFHMVWSLQKAQLIFPKQVRLFSFLPVRDDPAPSTRRAAATSHYSLSFHKHHSALSLLLQIAPSSGMCPLLHEDHFFLTSVLLKCEQLTSACDSRDGWGDRGRWPPACSCSRSDD